MRNIYYLGSSLIVPASLAALAPTAAMAQSATEDALSRPSGGIEEIVVTARRREETLQTTPLAITAVTAETLEERNIVDLQQVSRITPNFTLYETSGGLGSAGLYMRGIGYADNIPGQDSPIAIYSDGVLMGRNGTAMMDMVEPERVEVLRGPQGTLFGRNTTGGAVLITTHEPDDEFSGMVKTSYARFDTVRLQSRVDTGLLGNTGLKLSVAYSHRERDGTSDDIDRPDSEDPGAEKVNTYWAKLVGDWDWMRAMITADASNLEGYPQPLQVVVADASFMRALELSPTYGGVDYTPTQTPLFKLQDANGGLQKVKTRGIGATFEFNANDNLTIKTIGALRDYSRSDPSAYGPGNFRGLSATGEVLSFEGFYNITSREQEQKQRSLELQLLGTYDQFDFVAGAYYYYEFAEDRNTVRLPFPIAGGNALLDFPQARDYTAKTESLAGFAQANWRPDFLDEKLEVTGGIRWTQDEKEFVQVIPFDRVAAFKNDNFSYLASVKYQFTPDAMAYIRYSTGYRSGGYNARAALGSDPVFEPEKIKSLEGGFKLDLLDRRLRVNGAAFFNKYDNLQVGAFVAPSASDQGGNIAVNANAEYKGFELEAEAVPIDGLTLRGSIGYVDPEYTNYPTALIGGTVRAGCTPINNEAGELAAQDCADDAKFTYFSKQSIDLSFTYAEPVSGGATLSFMGGANYRSAVNFDTFLVPGVTPYQAEIRQPGYWLFSGRLAISDIPLTGGAMATVAVFGENLGNEKYSIQSIDFRNYATKYWGQRRTIGIEGKIDF